MSEYSYFYVSNLHLKHKNKGIKIFQSFYTRTSIFDGVNTSKIFDGSYKVLDILFLNSQPYLRKTYTEVTV